MRIACLVLAAALGVALASPTSSRCQETAVGNKYTTRYDNIDVNNILKTDRLFRGYVNCIMDRGGCTAEGCLLRQLIPDAIRDECSKCSDVQKKQAAVVLGFILQNKRSVWDELIAKYDPDGTFRTKYEFRDDDEEDYSDEKGD